MVVVGSGGVAQIMGALSLLNSYLPACCFFYGCEVGELFRVEMFLFWWGWGWEWGWGWVDLRY